MVATAPHLDVALQPLSPFQDDGGVQVLGNKGKLGNQAGKTTLFRELQTWRG